MSDLGINDIGYRLFRLRRLIGVAAVLPLPALGLAMLAQVPVGAWLALVWLGVVLYHVLRFPNAWLELIALALSLAIVLLTAPIAGSFGIGWWLGYPLALVAGGALWFALAAGLPALERFAWPYEVGPLRKHLGISPQAAREALFLRPNAVIGSFHCGPADKDGNFKVSLGAPERPETAGLSELAGLGLDLGAAPDAPDPNEHDGFSFLAKLVHSDPLSQEVMAVHNPGREAQEIQTLIQTLEPTPGGCRYEKIESGDVLGGVSGLGFWLTDADADDLTATLDQAAGRAARALRDKPDDTALALIGPWIRQKLAQLRARRSRAA